MDREQIYWDENDAKKYLMERGGSKAGAHAYLFDKAPVLQKHLPAGDYLAPGEDVEKFLTGIDATRAKIVRACHPLDVFGMVDVVPTLTDVRGRENIRHSIHHVLLEAKKKDVQAFVEYESGLPFNGNIGVFVQDYCGRQRGSVIEHPHERNLFRIGEVLPQRFSAQEAIDEKTCNQQGRSLDLSYIEKKESPTVYNLPFGNEDKTAGEVIALYQKVRDSGLMPSTYSFQMEFGWEEKTGDLKFYQARLFRPFEPMADIDILDLIRSETRFAITLPYDVFGITTEGGSEIMHRAELTKEFINSRRRESQVAYAHNAFEHRQTTPLDARPPNMGAYLPYQYQVLEHGHFRWMQKAPLTFVGKGDEFPGRNRDADALHKPLQRIGETVRVQLFSNGFRGVMRFLDYPGK